MDWKLLQLLTLYGQSKLANESSKTAHLEQLIKDRLTEKGIAYGDEARHDEFVKLMELFKEY